MTNPNGLHISVRAHLGGRFAGRGWIPIPDGGVDPEVLPHVQSHFGSYDCGENFLEVDEPTWESVKLEVERMKEKAKERRAEKTTIFVELANQYLEGGPHTWPTCNIQVTVGYEEKSVNLTRFSLSISSSQCDPDPALVAEVIAKYKQLNQDAKEREDAELSAREALVMKFLPRILAGEGCLGSTHFTIDDVSVYHQGCQASGQLEEERRRRMRAEEDARKQEIARFQEAEISWIKTKGSPRLLKAYAAGVHYQGIYHDERLTEEAFGWEYRKAGGLAEVANPSEEMLDLYIKALEIYKDAKMGFLPVEKIAIVYVPCPWRPGYLLTKSPKSAKVSPEEKNQMHQLLVQAVQEKLDKASDTLEQTLIAFSKFSPRELELVCNPTTGQTRSQLIAEHSAEAKKWRAALDWAKALP